ncbi:MAG: hypothetical protein J6V83_00630 [Clostridia bacterium]|nr:hypothetical protein [Clostridia bacterium]MBO7155889.1 hypothetical protein [Clostridia bacterium]
MDVKVLRQSYDMITKIVRDGAYVNVVLADLPETSDRALITKLVYGTIEKYYEINAIISNLCPKAPKPAVKIVMMQAIYAILYLEIPNYAIVSASVDLVQAIGKKELKGFTNAVLQKVCRKEYVLPTSGKTALEVKYNLPYPLIKAVKDDCGNNAEAVLNPPRTADEHVRLAVRSSAKEFEDFYKNFRVSKVGGYFVKNDDVIKRLFKRGLLTFQSPSSVFAVKALGDIKGKKLLDLCAAPGGKAVYSAELGAEVTACDIHPKRVALIESYARRMGVKLNATYNDGKKHRAEWLNAYDVVTVDAPCSGLGVISKRPDIALTYSNKDYSSLVAEQRAILEVASNYVKSGGTLLYSTCTVLKAENEDAVNDFLVKHQDFILEPFDMAPTGQVTLYPDGDFDGFYVAKMRKN